MASAGIEQFFREADTDNSGYITVQELSSLLQRKGYKVTDAQVKSMFNSIDVEGDEKVSYDEYLQGMGQRPATDHKSAHMRRVFRSFDKSGDGHIDKSELTAAFKEMKSSMTEAEIQKMMSIVDKDGSGTLDYEEFIERVFGHK
jgi:Ca2+-binding EF-hand superfamily protein